MRIPSSLLVLIAPIAVSAFTPSSSFLPGSTTISQKVSSCSSTTLSMKTIAVFGASGLTSSECVYQALKNGDKVVGLTR